MLGTCRVMVAGIIVCGAALAGAAPLNAVEAPHAPGDPTAVLTPAPQVGGDAEKYTDLVPDTRLNKLVRFRAESTELAPLLEMISKGTGVDLSVAADVALRRVTLLTGPVSIRSAMQAMARISGAHWRIRTDAGGTSILSTRPDGTPREDVSGSSKSGAGAPSPDYELFESGEDAARRKAAIEKSSTNQAAERARYAAVLGAAVQLALLQRDPNKASFANVVAAFSPDQLQQAAETAERLGGIVAADNQSRFYNSFLFPTPLANLPPDAQNSIRGLLDRGEYKESPGRGRAVSPFDNGGSLDGALIGLVAADGGVRLGILTPGGADLWVSPFDDIAGQTIPNTDQDNDFDPAVAQELGSDALVDLRGASAAALAKRLHFPPSLSRNTLSGILQSVADQTGLSFAADDFLRTRTNPYSWLLTDQPDYSVRDALRQIARTFGHRMQYRSGVVYVETLTPGLDERSEPPGRLLARLRTLSMEHRPMRLQEYLDVAALTPAQLDTLVMKCPPNIAFQPTIFAIQRNEGFRFYAMLTPRQRAAAESSAGMPVGSLFPAQRAAFEDLTNSGLPGFETLTTRPDPGFYVRRTGKSDGPVTFLFNAVPIMATASARTYRLAIP